MGGLRKAGVIAMITLEIMGNCPESLRETDKKLAAIFRAVFFGGFHESRMPAGQFFGIVHKNFQKTEKQLIFCGKFV